MFKAGDVFRSNDNNNSRYEIKKKIGKGSFGQVYEVKKLTDVEKERIERER